MKDELGEKDKELGEKLDELRGKDKELQGKDKELQGKDKELEEKNKKLKENKYRDSITLIAQIRNLASEGFTAEKCANMLVADVSTVNKAYEVIKEYPESSDAKILELIEP